MQSSKIIIMNDDYDDNGGFKIVPGDEKNFSAVDENDESGFYFNNDIDNTSTQSKIIEITKEENTTTTQTQVSINKSNAESTKKRKALVEKRKKEKQKRIILYAIIGVIVAITLFLVIRLLIQ